MNEKELNELKEELNVEKLKLEENLRKLEIQINDLEQSREDMEFDEARYGEDYRKEHSGQKYKEDLDNIKLKLSKKQRQKEEKEEAINSLCNKIGIGLGFALSIIGCSYLLPQAYPDLLFMPLSVVFSVGASAGVSYLISDAISTGLKTKSNKEYKKSTKNLLEEKRKLESQVLLSEFKIDYNKEIKEKIEEFENMQKRIDVINKMLELLAKGDLDEIDEVVKLLNEKDISVEEAFSYVPGNDNSSLEDFLADGIIDEVKMSKGSKR